jgi:hypothetical protein
MSEFILQNDQTLEFQNTRQSTKLTFLQQEIRQLQDYIKDLDKMVKINREALRISLYQTTPIAPAANTKLKNGNDTTGSTNDPYSDRDTSKTLQLLLDQLFEENTKLITTVDRLSKERNIAQSKALISEQICEEAQRHELESVAELDEKAGELRKILQDKEYVIQELEKINPVKDNEGSIIRYREVLPPTEGALKVHNDVETAQATLTRVSKEFNKLQMERQELLTVNFNLMNELNKIRNSLNNGTSTTTAVAPTKALTNLIMGGPVDLDSSQFGLGNLPDSEDSLSPANSPLPDKVDKGSAGMKMAIPKLDLTKAKKIQEINAKKSTQPAPNQPVAGDPKLIDRIKLIEADIENTKKLLNKESINNKIMTDELSSVLRQNVMLGACNETLNKSNKRYEEKWQKIFYTLEFYREFYHKYIDLISNRAQPATRSVIPYPMITKLDNVRRLKEKFNIDLESSPDLLIKGLKKIDEENGKHINISILEGDENDPSGDHHKRNILDDDDKEEAVYELTMQQCKMYLQNLAKELYINCNINSSAFTKQMLSKIDPGVGADLKNNKAFTKLKRSLSNPLDYIDGRKKEVFERKVFKPKSNKKADRSNKKEVNILEPEEGQEEAEDLSFNQQQGKKFTQKIGVIGDDISFNMDQDDIQNNKKMQEISFISAHDIFPQ